MPAPVNMTLEYHALLCNLSVSGERKNLVAATIRKDRFIPSNEFMKAACIFNYIKRWTQKQVIRVAKNDLCLYIFY